MSKKLFIKGTLLLTFAGLLSRLMGFFYRIFLSHTIGAHGLGIFQLILPLQILIMSICASGIQTAISRLTAAEKVSKNPSRHISDYFVVGTVFSVVFSLVFSWFLYSYADFWAVQILKESQTSGLIRILSLSIPLSTLHTCISSYYLGRKQAGFPAGVQLLEQLFRTGGCYILYLICASQGRNITPAIAVGGNLIGEIASSFISLFAVSMHFKVTHYNIRNIRRPLSVLRKLLHISVPLTMNKILLTLLGSIEVILIPARLQMSGLTPKDSLSVYGIFTGMALPLILFPATLTNSAATMLIPSITQLQTELLKTWESERKTCFFITHDVDEAIILAQRVIVMSARPGRIKDIVDIDIPYPRDQETKMSPRFMELKNHIWSQVYQEYLEVRK